jgi:hypothetical protein
MVIQQGPSGVIKCELVQENVGNISVVNNIDQTQKTEFINSITNDVKSELTQEQQQSILEAFEGEGKSNIAEIENELKNIISNTSEQALNNFINTATFNGNDLTLKVDGIIDCNGGKITQRNVSDVQIQNFIISLQDALAQSDVVNTISNSIAQKNTSGLADIFKYIIIGAVILGIIAVIGGGLFGIFKLKSNNKICSQDSDCSNINGYCGNKKKNPQTGKEQGICMPKKSIPPTLPKK